MYYQNSIFAVACSELQNKFLVLKYEERMGRILGLFPKEAAKRKQLLQQGRRTFRFPFNKTYEQFAYPQGFA
jgi:hypothetical protein